MANVKRRQEILAAALELFDERGFYGTGMEDIAQAVSMKAPSLYNHFGSKQEILAEITVRGMEELLRANAAALAGVQGPQHRLTAAMRCHVFFHATHAKTVRVTNAELGNLAQPHHSVVVQLRRDYVTRWMSVVHEGVETGVFHTPDVKIACWALIDMGIGVAQWFSPDGPYSADSLADLYSQLALRQLGA